MRIADADCAQTKKSRLTAAYEEVRIAPFVDTNTPQMSLARHFSSNPYPLEKLLASRLALCDSNAITFAHICRFDHPPNGGWALRWGNKK